MLKEVVNREFGRSRPSSFANRVRASRLSSIKISNSKEIVSLHKGAVNTLQVEMNFKMPGKVHGIAMSSIARSHMLIATGTEYVQVHLCDIPSGAFTHTLSGHRGAWPSGGIVLSLQPLASSLSNHS